MRQANDSYQTPPWCVDLVMAEFAIPGICEEKMVWLEPAKGDGVIYSRIPSRNKRWMEIQQDRDYLKTPAKDVDIIITNPPFVDNAPFLRKAIQEDCADLVVFLMRLSFLARLKKAALPSPTHLFVLSKRPAFLVVCTHCKHKEPIRYIEDKEHYPVACSECGGSFRKQADNSEYAWYVWDHGYPPMMLREPGIYTL